MSLVGKRVMFNPILSVEVYQGNGIDLIKQEHPQIEDNGDILGTIVKDMLTTALVSGPVELNGWHFVYLMPKSVLNVLN